MNSIYRIGRHYVRAANSAMARSIVMRVIDGEPMGIKLEWAAAPILCDSFINQQFGNTGYDTAINDETAGMVERFARKAIANRPRNQTPLSKRAVLDALSLFN